MACAYALGSLLFYIPRVILLVSATIEEVNYSTFQWLWQWSSIGEGPRTSPQADFRCGLAAGFFAAATFAGFLPAKGMSIVRTPDCLLLERAGTFNLVAHLSPWRGSNSQ
ncbi:hypothetical protein ACVWWO_003452 [Bradyrhizobium sp. F1.13.1]